MNVDHTFTERITVAPFTGRDTAGDPTYGAQVADVPARIEREVVTVRNAEGRLVESKTTIYSSRELGLMDRVWLPEASTASTDAADTPIAVATEKDLDGIVVLYLAYL